MAIITSGEHYGAVLNLDFNYPRYLQTLADTGLNGTRTWAGAYCEPPSAFQIASNTLAPLPGRFICPWARSAVPGYANRGNKFDLDQWDAPYFRRLKDFMSRAGRHGIVVELNLFCPFYDESMWRLSPMHASNNINGVGAVSRTNVYTLDRNGGLLAVQESMVRKLVSELNAFDNLYYEICNEPYFGGVTLEWQRHMADVIAEAERPLKRRHLISQNIANSKAQVTGPHPQVSIFNFHYATPPDTVALNYHLNKVVGDNETGFRGTNDAPYRMEAWDFIVAGGGLFNHLDYSFTAGHEDGTFVYPAMQPGGGNPSLRRQIQFLAQTLHRCDFIHMRPDDSLLATQLPAGMTARLLAKPGSQYLVYLRAAAIDKKHPPRQIAFEGLNLIMSTPEGSYRLEWLDPKNCSSIAKSKADAVRGRLNMTVPGFEEDIALLVSR